MCKMTLKKRISRVPSLEELQRDVYRETLEHMVDNLMKKKDNTAFLTARDFDTYQSDDDEVIVNRCIDEIIDKLTEN